MKKLFITLAAIFAISTVASAQLYVGGSVGISTEGGSDKAFDGTDSKLPSTFGIDVSPRVGYYLNDKFSVGVELGINYEKNTGFSLDPEHWRSEFMFEITPYARYTFLTFGKLGVNLEGGIGIGFGSESEKDQPSENSISRFNFNLYVVPVLTYDLTSKITLETELNFCSLGFFSRSRTDKQGDQKHTTNNNGFGLVVDTGDALSVGGNSVITLGFSYKF